MCGTLPRSHRQLLAAIFDESARRNAKSVQCSISPKGVLRASVAELIGAKKQHLGYFDMEEGAAAAYSAAKRT